MAFMQKAMTKQRERAREEASVVLRELEEAAASAAAEDNSSGDDTRAKNGNKNKKRKGPGAVASWGESDPLGDTKDGANTRVSKEARAAAAAEVAQSLPPGAVQSSVVSMDATLKSRVVSPITIDLGAGGSAAMEEGVETDARGGNSKSLDGSEGGAEEIKGAKRRRESAAGADGGGSEGMEMASDNDEDEEEEEDEADASNPWLAPTPRRSKERRRASNGEVLLDVRKAAATALSAFSGASDDKGAADQVNGSQGGTDEEASAKSSGGDGNGEEGKGKGGKSKKKRKNKRKRGSGDGGGGGGGDGGGDGSKGDGDDSSAATPAGEKETGGKGENGAGEVTAAPTGAEQPGSKKKKKKKKGKATATPATEPGSSIKTKTGKEGTGANKNKKKKAGAPAAERKKKAGKAGAAGAKGNPGATRNEKKKGGDAAEANSKLAGLSNDELVRRAFAAPDFDTEFKDSKDDEIEEVLSKGREKLPGSLAGWGAWAGDGAPVPRRPTKRQMLVKQVQVTPARCSSSTGSPLTSHFA